MIMIDPTSQHCNEKGKKKSEIKVEKFNNREHEGDRINIGFGTNTSIFSLTIHHFQTSALWL